MISNRIKNWVRKQAQQLAFIFEKAGLNPNALTITGMLITFAAAALVAFDYLLIGGIVFAIGSLFDILDGALARRSANPRPFGAFLDSTTDRYSESAIYIGIATYYIRTNGSWQILALMAGLAGSFLVSYVRARAQSLGYECEGGLFPRPERVIVTAAGLILGEPVLNIAVWLLAFFANLTAVQRIFDVWHQAKLTHHHEQATDSEPHNPNKPEKPNNASVSHGN
jgi:CDP-diacylglycerol--glycerol-3-phosphate 3-phosphatidyltransferase